MALQVREQQPESGTVFTAGAKFQKGSQRINYKVRDGNDNVFYFSISASGSDPFYRADQLQLEVGDDQYHLNGRLARKEEDLGISYLD